MTLIDIIQSVAILLLAVMAFSNSFMINEFREILKYLNKKIK